MVDTDEKNIEAQEPKPKRKQKGSELVNEPNVHLENEKLSKNSFTADIVKSAVEEILNKKLTDLKSEIKSEIEKKHDEVSGKFDALLGRLGNSESLLADCSKELSDSHGDLRTLKENFPNQVNELIASSELVNNLRKENESLRKDIDTTNKELDDSNKKLEDIQSQLNRAKEEKDTMIKWIAKILGTDEIVSSMEDVKGIVDKIQNKLIQQGEKIENLVASVKEQEVIISTKEQDLHRAEKEFSQKLKNAEQELNARMDDAREEYAQMKQSLSSKLTEKEIVCKNFEGKIEEMTKSENDLKNRLETVRRENEEKQKTIKQLDEKLTEVNEEKKSLFSSLTLSNSQNQEFQNAMKPYMDILETMKKCDSMRSAIVDSLGLPATDKLSVEQQIMYVNKFADKFTFARIVYDSMKSYKEANTEALTENELAAIQALNGFYRQRFSIKFDALDCGIASGSAFDRKKMKLISDPSNTDVIDVSFLCVPALYMMNGKDLEQKALIQGS